MDKAARIGAQEVTQVLRVIDPLIEEVVFKILSEEPTFETLMVLSVVMQYTDRVNYSVLTYLIDNSQQVEPVLFRDGLQG